MNSPLLRVSNLNVRSWSIEKGRLVPDERLWTVADVAQRLGVSEATVRSYRWRGTLPEPRYVGRTPVWEPGAIEEWIKRRPGRGAGGGRKPGRSKSE
ncbi:helix-turn-helix transcriptional regulator [Streptomyces albogriseolus]|uniref:helix-turn-helix transcriptional regulator n=1 Tax=Streptomyces albogriseolus TaxID=1887 RepID=UPI0036F5BC8E